MYYLVAGRRAFRVSDEIASSWSLIEREAHLRAKQRGDKIVRIRIRTDTGIFGVFQLPERLTDEVSEYEFMGTIVQADGYTTLPLIEKNVDEISREKLRGDGVRPDSSKSP